MAALLKNLPDLVTTGVKNVTPPTSILTKSFDELVPPNTSWADLPPQSQALKSMKIEMRPGIKPDDFPIFRVDGTPTNLTVRDIDRLGKGSLVDEVAPDLATLYRRMGIADDAAGTIAKASDELAANFRSAKGFQDMQKLSEARRFGTEYRRVYGNDATGMRRFLDDNPSVLDEFRRNPNAIKDLKFRNTVKKYVVGAAITAATLAVVVEALKDYCKDKNGCRRIRSDGRVEKIVLLTCDDGLLGRNDQTRMTSTEVTDVPTCVTQVYSSGTATVACASTTFNPCQTNKRRSDLLSANGTLAMVPNVCDQYAVRKETDVANSKKTATNTVAAACDGANVDPDSKGMCSKLCKKESFSDPQTGELMCVQMDIGDALGEVLKDFGSDVFDKVMSNIPGAGAVSWLKWVLIGLAIVLVLGGGVLAYRKFSSKKNRDSADWEYDGVYREYVNRPLPAPGARVDAGNAADGVAQLMSSMF